MTDRIDEFIIEAREHLAIVEESLLNLERHSSSIDSSLWVDRCFRSIHSIKGDAGYLGLRRINELAHAMESLLESTQSTISLGAIEVLLSARDRLAVLVDDANRSHLIDNSDVLAQLKQCAVVGRRNGIDIDLAQWNSAHPGGIRSYVRQIATDAGVLNGRIQLDQADLRSGLPAGRVRWTVEFDPLQSAATSKPLAQSESARGCRRVEQIRIDLTALTSVHGGILGKFRELSNAIRVRSGHLAVPAVDLRAGLPTGDVVWTAECETDLSQQELERQLDLVSRRDQTPFSRLVQDQDNTISSPALSDDERSVEGPGLATTKAPSTILPLASDKVTTLRIQVELLDRMMNLVGELTLVRNQSLLAFSEEEGAHWAIIQRLNSVTSELQDVTLRSRMQPVGNLFHRFPRMVRDLARQLGKQVEIDLQGREVEMDKSILEQLSDPLMHLVRNSVDHGIEMPEERRARGKSPVGQIVLSATHKDGQIHIQIRDDGRGINPDAVKAKALALGLKSEAELARMTSRELHSLIVLPGFSTAKNVTEVSGRGVGMDVVKTNIEQLEGSLSIDSVVGQGSSIALRLPLTLAIIPSLIVKTSGSRFAVPQRDLEEVVCLHPQSPCRTERAFDTEVYRLREKLLPIIRLCEVLRRKQPLTSTDKAEMLTPRVADSGDNRIEYILVLRVAGKRFGLVVDDIGGTQEIVVKPMHSTMKRIGIFSGATIMGDGHVSLILDAQGICEHARLSFESTIDESARRETVRDASQAHRVLLFEYGPLEQFALPLIQIRRVEMISPDRIERVGDHEFVTVDGVSTRILRLNQVLNVSKTVSDLPLLSLILPKFLPQPMGILASRIVDTESLALDLQEHADEDPGILGSAIVRDRLTLFLEMHRLFERLFDIATPPKPIAAIALRGMKRILLIDDTAFFREVVKRYLVAEGYEIVTVTNGEEGLERLAADPQFDLIVSDIEMPVMDGWEFARIARRRGITTPMLALTSLSGVQFEAKARDCGYDGYEVKLDHDRLVQKVSSMLAAQEGTK